MVEETEKSVQVHVGRPFQEELFQRVLEIVDPVVRVLQEVILEDGLVHVSVSRETALED